MKLIISLLLAVLSVQIRKEIEIIEDFTGEIEYKLEGSDTNWRKRGTINFTQKNSNSKKNIYVINEPIEEKQFEEIANDCKHQNSLYYLRINIEGNIYFSSVKSCDILAYNFNDKLIINHLGQLEKNSIISINYDVNDKHLLEKEKNGIKQFNSIIDFVDQINAFGPIFADEKENSKPGQIPEQQSFFSKYWWIIMIVVVMVMIRGPSEEGASE